jgi:uncharacterized protein
MIGEAHRLTAGYVARHVPPGSRLGIDIAVLDIAQDFLLAHLHEAGFFPDLVVFKGGTALRKFFAGSEGRFSTDLDLAAVELDVNRQELAEVIAEQATVTLGPFRFEARVSRSRWHIRVMSEFGNPSVSMKLDVGPPCWLRPEERPFVETKTQARYGFPLPHIPVMHSRRSWRRRSRASPVQPSPETRSIWSGPARTRRTPDSPQSSCGALPC